MIFLIDSKHLIRKLAKLLWVLQKKIKSQKIKGKLNQPCVCAFVGATLADAVVIVWAGAVVTVVIANVIADVFPLLLDVLITGKCTNDSNCPKSRASLSIPPTKSARPKRAYQRKRKKEKKNIYKYTFKYKMSLISRPSADYSKPTTTTKKRT